MVWVYYFVYWCSILESLYNKIVQPGERFRLGSTTLLVHYLGESEILSDELQITDSLQTLAYFRGLRILVELAPVRF